MRRIEERLLEAIESNKSFRISNTEYEPGTAYGCVYLFGHLIARIYPDGTRLYSNCGYYTNTTKSRLNALGAGIHQRNFEWYDADGNPWRNDF